MSTFGMVAAVALMLVGLASALPNKIAFALENMPDITQPQNTMMGQSLKEMGIEVCPDNLHLCPATAECCEKENGKWDCCPKAEVPIAGECCLRLGYIWTCCPPLVPKCKWSGCWGK